MLPRALVLWLIPVLGLVYTPPTHEILPRMEITMRNSEPLVVEIVREAPDGSMMRELSRKIPAEPDADLGNDSGFATPFLFFTLPKNEITRVFGSVFQPNAPVSLDSIGGSVCYFLDGGRGRLWLQKNDLVSLKAESYSPFGELTTCFYLDFIALSKHFSYPARTEVYRDGLSLFVGRLVSPLTNLAGP